MAEQTGGIVLLVRKPDPEPCIEERAERAWRESMFSSDPDEHVTVIAAALRAAIEDAARVAEGMGFEAVAARIRRLKEDDHD